MTQEEAIDIINKVRYEYTFNCGKNSLEVIKALDIAIESLSSDRPSGEWAYLRGSIGSYMTISCPFCGNTFNDVAEWKYNYCPSCGANMHKGGDEE